MKTISRRAVLSLGGQASLLIFLAACATATPTLIPLPPPTALPPNTSPPATVPPSPAPLQTSMPTSVSTTAVDLDTKIGQMLMLGFRGMEVKPENTIAADIRDRHLGAVVLFNYDTILQAYTRNISSPAQLQILNNSLQALAKTPLFISTDQEGGIITRLTEANGFPPTESEQFYGTKNDLNETRMAAEAEGKVLKAAGINLVLAPVVDLNLNPNNPIIGKYERSFSANPQIVTDNARAEIEGFHAQGILTTLKHFPGHGSSTADSHLGFVDVTPTWQEIELEPYRNLINAGVVDAIMTAHIFNAKLDPQYPATLSKSIITGILREQLKYDGVVISDDMQMGAIRQYFGYEQAVELAINAGVDILAIANNTIFEPEIGARTVGIIKQLVADGKITPERIEQSYQRILHLKSRLS